jgi:hypothetical protein
MSLLKANSVQIGQSTTGTNNFTLSVPSSPDGTIKLARGNSGATTADIFSVNGSGAIAGATISGATINSSTLNGGSITLGTAQNTTSGTAIDFTGIPSWAKKITVMFRGVSVNGTSAYLVQAGTSSGVVSTGYISTSNILDNAGASNATNSTSGFIIFNDNASYFYSGHIVITLLDTSTNAWVSSHSLKATTTLSMFGAGDVALSGTLDRIRITTVSANTFDAGSINIMYEG